MRDKKLIIANVTSSYLSIVFDALAYAIHTYYSDLQDMAEANRAISHYRVFDASSSRLMFYHGHALNGKTESAWISDGTPHIHATMANGTTSTGSWSCCNKLTFVDRSTAPSSGLMLLAATRQYDYQLLYQPAEQVVDVLPRSSSRLPSLNVYGGEAAG